MEKEKMKYTLPFVNEGKPFELGKWTNRKHQKVLVKMTEYEKKHSNLSEQEKDEKYQNTLIKIGLDEIDIKIKEDDLLDMHPADKTALFAAVYYNGREGIIYHPPDSDAGNFPKKTK